MTVEVVVGSVRVAKTRTFHNESIGEVPLPLFDGSNKL